MYIERFNKVLNKAENLDDLNDYRVLIDSLINYLENDEEEVKIDDLIKEKIKNFNGNKKSYIALRLLQITQSLENLYLKELKNVKKEVEILIKNQKAVENISVNNKEAEKVINYLKFLYQKEGQEIAQLYFEIIELLKDKIKEIKKIAEDFKKEKELHILKLLLYNYYFVLKIIEEEYKKKKEKINRKIEKINKESYYLLEKFKEKQTEDLFEDFI